MSSIDYQIVVPSRARTHNMLLIQQLLPSATICVDEREVEDYIKFVPREKLLVHPPIDFFAPVLNWILANTSAEILV